MFSKSQTIYKTKRHHHHPHSSSNKRNGIFALCKFFIHTKNQMVYQHKAKQLKNKSYLFYSQPLTLKKSKFTIHFNYPVYMLLHCTHSLEKWNHNANHFIAKCNAIHYITITYFNNHLTHATIYHYHDHDDDFMTMTINIILTLSHRKINAWKHSSYHFNFITASIPIPIWSNFPWTSYSTIKFILKYYKQKLKIIKFLLSSMRVYKKLY